MSSVNKNSLSEHFDDGVVFYMEIDDFEENGNFKHPMYNRYMLIMIGGSYCGHCRIASPEFNKFAKNNKDIICGVIQVDGSDGEKQLGKMLGKFHAIKGIPTFLLYGPNGQFIKIHEGDRTEEAFKEFCQF